MIAVDTNIFVRLMVNDDARMADAAIRLLTDGGMFVSKTVLLETHWVLTSQMQLLHADATKLIAATLGFPTVEVEGGSSTHAGVQAALDGLDFEDALHLASTPDGMAFATFDDRLRKRSARLGFPIHAVKP